MCIRDSSNTARAYVLLQKIGWITLDSGVDPSAVTQDDIVENPKNLEFVEMKSLTIPAAIQMCIRDRSRPSRSRLRRR